MTDTLAPPVDLATCDREPIHVPGSIQPHGALLSLDPGTLRIAQASANTEAYLGAAPESLLGRPLADALGEDFARAVARALEQPDPREANPLRVEVQTPAGPRLFDGVLSRWDDVPVVELEPAAPHSALTLWSFHQVMRQSLARLQRAQGIDALAAMMAEQVRLLTGFDRVMVYRFDKDGHGQVIAEEKADRLEPFLGLHYPESDIPRQAREMYRRNWIRAIPDIGYTPVPVVPAAHPSTGRPLDMTLGSLRSVSPIHVEYLSNMGVTASMSVSLLRGGDLWGLIACHHYSPLLVPFEVRTACELLGQAFSTQVASMAEAEEREMQLRTSSVLGRLLDFVAREDDWARAVTEHTPNLLDLVHAEGVALAQEETVTLGSTPPAGALSALRAWLDGAAGDDAVYHTDQLGRDFPGDADGAAGLLALRLVPRQDRWILWFRAEQAQSVDWAGDPRKAVTADAEGGERLSPRGSFALWRQEVRGRSLPWRADEEAAARELRSTVVEVVLRRAAELDELNRELRRSNEELDAFAYVASHDLKEPLRGIHNYAAMLADDLEAELDAEARDRFAKLMRLTQRMDGLIESLLYFSRVGRLELETEELDAGEALDEAVENLSLRIRERSARIEVPAPLPRVRADRHRLREIFQNLVSNALKYNDSEVPVVRVTATRDGGGPAVFSVADNGIGIPERHRGTVFRIFKRLHARDAYGGGTGAGLTIVQRIVERHGGRIWVDEPRERGTTFSFTLEPDHAPR